MNEAIYRSPEWLRKFADFELRTGKDLKGDRVSNKEETKSDWNKKWDMTDKYLFKQFYEEVYPDDFRNRYKGVIPTYQKIRDRFRGDFEIFKKFDLWLVEKSKREQEQWRRYRENKEREAAERRKEEEEKNRISKDLDDLYDRVTSDFKSAPYQDKASTPIEDGEVCFRYTFEDGSFLFLKDKNLTYGNLTYVLGYFHRKKFVNLANYLFESTLWREKHQRPSGQRKRTQQTESNDPKSNHPKWSLYQNLKQTVIRREEQLKKMSKNDTERSALENEYKIAKATLDKLKNQYQFEHLKAFEKYGTDEEIDDDRGEKHPDEEDFIEDLFMEYVDEWNMKPGEYLSDTTTQPKGFNADHYNLFYTIYESFCPKIARLYVPSDYYIELNITAHKWKGDINKEKLFSDIDKFLIRIQKYGWKYVESKTQNKKSFLNMNPKVGEHYDDHLVYYFYKD